jgi:flavin-dependent dehydrogenase
VVVIGGGPAGSAAALHLVRAGWSLVLLERSRYQEERVGEMLPPEAQSLLGELGLWERFLAVGHLASPGIISTWGGPELYEYDFVTNPHGPGWHLDRRRFDLMLALGAAEAGATLLQSARVRACAPDGSGGWRLDAVSDSGPILLHAGFLIDATGRSASPARPLGGRRIVYDRLIGLVGVVMSPASDKPRDRRTLIEATEFGWWYSAHLPNDSLIATFMTDADLLPGPRTDWLRTWMDRLRQAPHTANRVGPRKPKAPLRVVAAGSSRMERVAERNRVAVGDAACAFDPLSAQGIFKALATGLAAARAVEQSRRDDPSALGAYAARVEAGFDRYLRQRTMFYGRERRWPDSLFWKRRQS